MLCPDCFSVSRLLTVPRDLFYSNRLTLGSAEKKRVVQVDSSLIAHL